MNDLKEDIAPHIEELYKALEKKVPISEIEKELNELIKLGVPLEVAKQSVLRKYRSAASAPRSQKKNLLDLKSGERGIELSCKILSISKRTVMINNQERTIFSGLVADETGTKAFTAWADFNLKPGETVRIQNAYTTEWQGNVQINLSDNTHVVVEEGDTHLAGIELKPVEAKIKELKEGMVNVAIVGKILSVMQKEVDVKGVKKTNFSGVLGDETGKIQFTAWKDFNLKENDVVKIVGGQLRARRGLLQINFDERATVEKQDIELDVKDREISIGELERIGGGLGFVIEGFVLDIKPGSGLVLRCSECRRVIQKGTCIVHGAVESIPDLRVKAVVDDGTGLLNVLLGKNITERLIGKSLEECKRIAEQAMSQEAVVEEISESILLKPIRLSGYTLKDDVGLTFIATALIPLERDIKEEARAMLEKAV